MIVAFYMTLLLKMFIYSELYSHSIQCLPVMYFFGQKNGCKQYISKLSKLGLIGLSELAKSPNSGMGVESYVDFSRYEANPSLANDMPMVTTMNRYIKSANDWIMTFLQEMGMHG